MRLLLEIPQQFDPASSCHEYHDNAVQRQYSHRLTYGMDWDVATPFQCFALATQHLFWDH
ncbi:hypothetical protein D3C77_788660 [compost metagenome]